MATLSTHTLDAVDGTHAGPVEVELVRLTNDGGRERVFLYRTDEGGRLSPHMDLSGYDARDRYELIFGVGQHFATHANAGLGERIVEDVIVRLRLPDPDGKYHIPIILAPNGASLWWSS